MPQLNLEVENEVPVDMKNKSYKEQYMTEITILANGRKYIRSWFVGYKMVGRTAKKNKNQKLGIDRSVKQEVEL